MNYAEISGKVGAMSQRRFPGTRAEQPQHKKQQQKKHDKTTTMSENIKQRRKTKLKETKFLAATETTLSGTTLRKGNANWKFSTSIAQKAPSTIDSKSINQNNFSIEKKEAKRVFIFPLCNFSRISGFWAGSPQSLHDFLQPQTTHTILNTTVSLLVQIEMNFKTNFRRILKNK
jgi:hypothetical protein